MLLIQVHRGNSLRIALKHDYTSFTGYSSRGLVCAAVFIYESLSLYCCFHLGILLILMIWEHLPIEIHMSAPMRRAWRSIC